MDRILYKEADGDITCRSRDFDKVFPTLYAYEETGMTPDEIKELIANHNALVDELLAKLEQAMKERDAMLADLKREHRCSSCKHIEDTEHQDCMIRECEFCENCHCYACLDGDNWEWRGAKDTNVPTKKEE